MRACHRVRGSEPPTSCGPCPTRMLARPRARRAPQIARIAATTVVCPGGLFVVNEDGGLDKAEEWAPLPDREMAAPANWAHRWGRVRGCLRRVVQRTAVACGACRQQGCARGVAHQQPSRAVAAGTRT